MSFDENENHKNNDKEIIDNNNIQNLDELTKLTNFTFGQINSFRKYFRNCKLPKKCVSTI